MQRLALLGMRFMDPTLELPVSDQLTVTIRRAVKGARHIRARPNGEGIFTFEGLPGLLDYEFGAEAPAPRDFIVSVTDPGGRFLPVCTVVSLPAAERLQEFYLFPAPTRPPVSGIAAIRGQLWDKIADRPAAHALAEVTGSGSKTWYGVADERGCIAVFVSYPAIQVSGPNPHTPPPLLYSQVFNLTLKVRYQAAALALPTDSAVPDLADILSQPYGKIYATVAGPPANTYTLAVPFGQDFTLRTGAESTLLIRP